VNPRGSEHERRILDEIGRGQDARSTDIGSYGGVPGWLASNFKFCARCGAPLSLGPVPGDDRDRLACSACGHITYVNPRLVVSALPVTEAGELILLRRGIEPGYGSWAQPGGFLEVDETVAEAAIRETLE
jgi:NADH pyrophosphatase NudC (nudix superfamily)